MAENDKTGEIVYLTNKEVEELKKEAKFSCYFKDEGWRYGSYSQIFGIESNKVSGKIPKRYVEQLEYMGYDVSKLEYELKELDCYEFIEEWYKGDNWGWTEILEGYGYQKRYG